MSRRTAEANKAIRLAWEREYKLVNEGKGTRDWTVEQQRDILDDKKGKAYDEDGRAFEGQHMKSVEKYPEFQGDYNNIQFLTKKEHLDAHKGNWQNPTNWYYDPMSKEYFEFDVDILIPCKVIDLSNPIVEVKTNNSNIKDKKTGEKIKSVGVENTSKIKAKSKVNKTIKKSFKNNIMKKLPRIAKVLKNHPEAIIATVVGGVKIVISLYERKEKKELNKNNSLDLVNLNKVVNDEKEEVIENKNVVYTENDVPGHKQRYHKKDGVIWKEKDPYHRGGGKDL